MNENEFSANAVPRMVSTMFFLVDTSKSMIDNGNIGKVNTAIEEMIPLLKEVAAENADSEIKLAVLEFSTGCRWITVNGPESLETFFWNDLQASGLTEMGAAFLELDSKLSRSAYLASSTAAYPPVIILLTDGEPTDDWEAGLSKLSHNNWYRVATKIGIVVDGGDVSTVEKFTGSSEAVLKVNSNRDDLKSLLKRVAQVSSQLVTRSKNVGETGNLAEKVVKEVKENSSPIVDPTTVINPTPDPGGCPEPPKPHNEGKWGTGW